MSVIEEVSGGETLGSFSGRKWFLTTGWAETIPNYGVDGNFTTNPPDVSGVLHFGFTDGTSNGASVVRARIENDFTYKAFQLVSVGASFSADIEYGIVTEEFDETETTFSNLTTTVINTDSISSSGDVVFGGPTFIFDFVRELSGGSVFGYYVTLKNVSYTSTATSNIFDFLIDSNQGSLIPKTFYTT